MLIWKKLFTNADEDYQVKVVETVEACRLLEAGFE